MIDRPFYKNRAKAAFKRNYWMCVLAAFIVSLLGGTLNIRLNFNYTYSHNGTPQQFLQEFGNSGLANEFGGLIQKVLPFALVGGFITLAIGLALVFFVRNPLAVGAAEFFSDNARYNAPISKVFHGFTCGHYMQVVGTMCMATIRVLLWSLLFVIPGIIKSYSYFMVPYLVGSHPEMSTEQILETSSEIMKGRKMQLFILDLSFLGWMILAGLTLGIVGIFWVTPYMEATRAELYNDLADSYQL